MDGDNVTQLRRRLDVSPTLATRFSRVAHDAGCRDDASRDSLFDIMLNLLELSVENVNEENVVEVYVRVGDERSFARRVVRFPLMPSKQG